MVRNTSGTPGAPGAPGKLPSHARRSSRRRPPCVQGLDPLEPRLLLTVFTVISDADDGAGSLREAIVLANASTNFDEPDIIEFNIPGSGVRTITPATALPTITDPVVIDGYTQPGSSPNSVAGGLNALPLIELDGSAISASSGFRITAGNTTVRGLIINGFDRGVVLQTEGDNVIAGNFIGTDAAGTAAVANRIGVEVLSSNNIIGGSTPDLRNLISGNTEQAVLLGPAGQANTVGNTVQGNLIGTNKSAGAALPNGVGVEIVAPGLSHNIGGTAAGAGNVISGNTGDGVRIGGGMGHLVQGNLIGVNTGGGDLGNGGDGIFLSDAGGVTVGGVNAAEGNIIAFNGGAGVFVTAGASGVAIQANSIFGNTGLGIDLAPASASGVTANDNDDLDNGPNRLQNFPVLTSADTITVAGKTVVRGTLNATPDTTFRVEFFSGETADPSGFGEGQNFLGAINVSTNSGGDTTFEAQLNGIVASGWSITATATDSLNNSSEFSAPVSVLGPKPDLEPEFDPNPVDVLQGQSTVVEVTVTNLDAADAGSSLVRVYASTDGAFDPQEDTLLGSATADPLEENEMDVVGVTLNVPAGLAAGDYTLFAVVDAANSVDESDEENNVVASAPGVLTVSEPPTPADLTATFDPAPLTLVQAGSQQVTVTATNAGETGIGADFLVRVYASADGAFDAGSDTLIGSATVTQNVVGGASVEVPVTLNIPVGLAAGAYTLFAFADAGETITEGDENNNVAGSAPDVLTVTQGMFAELSVSAFDPPPQTIAQGASDDVAVEITNAGDAAAAAGLVVRVYASTDGVLDGQDVVLGEAATAAELAIGSAAILNVQISVPDDLAAGAYTLIAVVDPDAVVPEPNDNDNAAASDPDVLTVDDRPETQFGRASADRKQRVAFTDADGTRVTFVLLGPGIGTVQGGDGDASFRLSFTGTTDASLAQVIVNRGGDREAFLDGVSVDGSLRSFVARNGNLNGDFELTGTLRQLVLDDVGEDDTGAHEITIGGAGATARMLLSARFDDLNDVMFGSGMAMRSLVASSWFDRDQGATPDTLTAPSLRQLAMVGLAANGDPGDFEAHVTLTDAAVKLASVRVRSTIRGGSIRTAGDIGAVTAGAIVDGVILAGVAPQVDLGALPTFDQIGTRTIQKVTFTGGRVVNNQPSLTNSLIAAASVNTIRLRAVFEGEAAGPFGFVARTVKSYKSSTLTRGARALAEPGDYDTLGNYRLRILEVG